MKQVSIAERVLSGIETAQHGAGAAARRRAIVNLKAGREHHRRRGLRIAACSSDPKVRMRPDGTIYLAPGRCRDRLCPTCQAQRARLLMEQTMGIVQGWDSIRAITLTLKEDGCSIGERVDRLLLSFRRLRQRELWRSLVKRGIAVIEITPGRNGDGSHVHLHVLVEGSYFPQPQLKREWLGCTGDSSIVHVAAIHTRKGAAAYVAGYVTKSSDAAKWPARRLCELADGIKGRRMYFTIGKRMPRATDRVEEEPLRPPGRAVTLTSVIGLHAAAACGNVYAIEALALVPTLPPHWQRAFGMRPRRLERPRLLAAWTALDEFAAVLRAYHASCEPPPAATPRPRPMPPPQLPWSDDGRRRIG